MSRYMQTAAEANTLAIQLLALIPEDMKPQAAEMIARLVNLGIRCSPRGVQHTVRLNAVQRAVQNLPVRVGMVQRLNPTTLRTYNALITQPIGEGEAVIEGGSEED
jgi:hypothetical protein